MNDENTRRTFFEFLGIADQERVHTQMLAWLLDPRHSPLPAADRWKLLADGFGFVVDIEHVDRLEAVPELERIDLVVRAPDGVLAIENKLKSRQSDGQLAAYSARLQELGRAQHLPESRITGCFLTFSGEIADTQGWTNIDYAQLLRAIAPLAGRDRYVTDYVSLLSKLIGFRDEFFARHHCYGAVFKRSGMSARDRVKETLSDLEPPLVQFVCANRLERIFCESLLRRLAAQLSVGVHYVDESRGTALIDTRLFTLSFSGQTTEYRAGLQLQDATVKLNIGSSKYADSERAEIAPYEVRLDEAIVAAVNQSDSRRELKTNKATKKAYRSWSFRLALEGSLPMITRDAFISAHNKRLAWAKGIWESALEALRLDGTVVEYALATQETAGGEIVVD